MVNALELKDVTFEKIKTLLFQASGISMNSEKKELVKSRLVKHMKKAGFKDFNQYLEYVEADCTCNAMMEMIEALTTNVTQFFREPKHFDYLRQNVLPELETSGGQEIKVWSAGCSSGEEPYSLAIFFNEELKKLRTVRILGTDISGAIIEKASLAVYDKEAVDGVPPLLMQKYFTASGDAAKKTFFVNKEIKSLIRFARLNLMDEWPMKGPFDIIFCRNVMIYFNKETQENLVRRFWNILRPGGYLFIGHSESFTSITHDFKYLKPAVYKK